MVQKQLALLSLDLYLRAGGGVEGEAQWARCCTAVCAKQGGRIKVSGGQTPLMWSLTSSTPDGERHRAEEVSHSSHWTTPPWCNTNQSQTCQLDSTCTFLACVLNPAGWMALWRATSGSELRNVCRHKALTAQVVYWHSAVGKYASWPKYVSHMWTLYQRRTQLRGTLGGRALLSEQDLGMLLSGCVIKALWEGWSSQGSSGLHMWPGLIVVP